MCVRNGKEFTLGTTRKKDSRTRGHEVTLVKDQCRLDIRKYSISQRTIQLIGTNYLQIV